MKVLFLKDLKNVGQKGTVKEVSDGYALNSLIPNGQAVQATPDKVKAYELQRAQETATANTRIVMAEALLKKLSGKTFTVHADANEKGRLYKKLPFEAVRDAIAIESGEHLPIEGFHTTEPIHEKGSHTVTLSLEKSHATITVNVA